MQTEPVRSDERYARNLAQPSIATSRILRSLLSSLAQLVQFTRSIVATAADGSFAAYSFTAQTEQIMLYKSIQSHDSRALYRHKKSHTRTDLVCVTRLTTFHSSSPTATTDLSAIHSLTVQNIQDRSDKLAHSRLITSFHRLKRNHTTTSPVRLTYLTISGSVLSKAAQDLSAIHSFTVYTEAIRSRKSVRSR